MPNVRHDSPQLPSEFRFYPYHDGQWLCEPSPGILHIVSRSHCSCFDHHAIHQHEGTRCEHAHELARRLRAEGAALLSEACALTEPAVPESLPERCGRCHSPCYHYPTAARCVDERCSWRIVVRRDVNGQAPREEG